MKHPMKQHIVCVHRLSDTPTFDRHQEVMVITGKLLFLRKIVYDEEFSFYMHVMM